MIKNHETSAREMGSTPLNRSKTRSETLGFLDRLLGRPPQEARTLKRNAVCWCGSGKKYKKCHLTADQNHFAAKSKAPSCNSYG